MNRIIFLSVFFLTSFSLQAQQSILGKWKTIDDKSGKARSYVEIYQAPDGAIEGKVTEILLSSAPEGEEAICRECDKDDPRYNQKVEGMVIITDMKMAQNKQTAKGGQILDPESGNEYGCILTLAENGKKLKVRGFYGFKALGRTQVWLRNN